MVLAGNRRPASEDCIDDDSDESVALAPTDGSTGSGAASTNSDRDKRCSARESDSPRAAEPRRTRDVSSVPEKKIGAVNSHGGNDHVHTALTTAKVHTS